MLNQTCRKCGTYGQIYYDDDGISKALVCLNCGNRVELLNNNPIIPIDITKPKNKVGMVVK